MAAIAAAKLSRERVGRRRLIAPAGRIAMAVAGLCAAGLLAASPGYAGVTHPHLESFTGPEAPCDGMSSPRGLAVNEASGQLDVMASSKLLDAFSLMGGSYECVWQADGIETPQHEFSSGHIAVDGSAGATRGRIYVSNNSFGGVVDVLNSAGEYLFQFNGAETPAGSMVPYGIAVNGTSIVYVLDAEHDVVDLFSPEGKYLSQVPLSLVDDGIPEGLALDATGDVYVVFEDGTVAEFNSGGMFIRTIGTVGAKGVAVDRVTGAVFVLYPTRVGEYDATGSLVSQFGPPNINAGNSLTVNESSEDVYVSEGELGTKVEPRVDVFGPPAPAPDVTTGAASGLGETTATLSGAVDPESATLPASYQFEYSSSKIELEESKGTLSPSTPAGIGTGMTPESVSASLTGLTPNRTYYYRLLGFNENANGTNGRVESETATFVTTGPPEVGEAFLSEAGSTSAVLNADVNPGGLRTTYRVEYGTGTEYGSSTPEVTLGAQGHEPVAVAVTITGLQPETTYHARLVASNADSTGAAQSADQTFMTFPANTGLPDGRVYELVTPLDNHDADVYSPEMVFQGKGVYGVGARLPFQASEDGDAVTYAGAPTTGGNGSAQGGLQANQYLATRSASGWTQQNVSAPGAQESHYEAFSSDLSTGVLISGCRECEPPALLPEAEGVAGYPLLYARDNESGGERALYTSFEGSPPAKKTLFERFAGGSEGYGTLLFEASAALTEGAPSGNTVNDLYESRSGRLQLVNEVEGAMVPYATFGGPSMFDGSPIAGGGRVYGHVPDFSHDISANGKRVFWTAVTPVKNAKGEIEGERPRALYMSEAGAEPVQLDASQTGGVGGDGLFWTASSDGGRVFFTDPNRLTEASTAAAGQSDLYEYEAESGQLLDLTVDPGGHADVQGVIGSSEDGSYVYFVADGVLGDGAAHGATSGTCEPTGSNGECNLYVWHNGVTSFIAPLTGEDGLATLQIGFNIDITGYVGDWAQALGERTAEVSSSGEALVFQSSLKLSAYENAGLTEVYSYDAVSGGLACVSCNPSGERVQAPGGVGKNNPLGGFLDPSFTGTRATRWMSDDGDRVFFDSAVPLVPEDTNGLVDVYEWEREGTPGGSCPVLSPARLDGGCVFLLSGGTSDNDSYLYSTSASGGDVFFATRAQLVGADQSETFKVYDARVGGVQPPVAPSCSGTGCQGVPSAPPIFATPSSVTFAGVGNFAAPAPVKPATKPKAKPLTRAQKLAKALKACAKVKKAGNHASCVASARKRYGPVKAKRKSASKKGGK